METLDVQEDLTYREHPVRILEEAERRTRNRVIKFLKVQWSNHSVDEATWEREGRLRADYPYFFPERAKSRDEISVRGVGFVTSQILGCVSNVNK